MRGIFCIDVGGGNDGLYAGSGCKGADSVSTPAKAKNATRRRSSCICASDERGVVRIDFGGALLTPVCVANCSRGDTFTSRVSLGGGVSMPGECMYKYVHRGYILSLT